MPYLGLVWEPCRVPLKASRQSSPRKTEKACDHQPSCASAARYLYGFMACLGNHRFRDAAKAAPRIRTG